MDQDKHGAVIKHYTSRHELRGDTFGQQPYANYGYWTRPQQSIEQAATALTTLVGAAAGLGSGDELLDVGCGYGAGAVRFVQQFGVSKVIGIDVTQIRISSGLEYVARNNLEEQIHLRLGDATRIDEADASFDKLVSVECAFHFDTREQFLGEAARVLRPGGVLALTDMIPADGVDPASYQLGQRTVHSDVCLDMPANAYPAAQYRQILERSGFVDVRIESIVRWTRLPFADALDALGRNSEGERRQMLCRMAERNREQVALGEDYVLVSARKAG